MYFAGKPPFVIIAPKKRLPSVSVGMSILSDLKAVWMATPRLSGLRIVFVVNFANMSSQRHGPPIYSLLYHSVAKNTNNVPKPRSSSRSSSSTGSLHLVSKIFKREAYSALVIR